jgi:hypothetical protein
LRRNLHEEFPGNFTSIIWNLGIPEMVELMLHKMYVLFAYFVKWSRNLDLTKE